MRYLITSPWWFRLFFPGLHWRRKVKDKTVFLTFDDGPTPEVTGWVLDQLRQYDFKATFFLVGEMIEQHPEWPARLREEGHAIGNHSYRHLNGWEHSTHEYLNDFQRCEQLLDSNLFRPPYGRLKPAQARAIKKTHQVIMWDVLSADFDTSIDGRRCFKNVKENLRPGSIIVFHDSAKAFPNLREALPRTLEHLAQEGYRSQALHI